MSRYSLEVIAPTANENKLAFALDALALIHGGKVVEPSDAFTKTSYRRQCVNLIDCENSLEIELRWLRKEFPDTRFVLQESASVE